MNHYQKLAVLLIRCGGTAMGALGLFGSVYGTVLRGVGMEFRPDQAERYYASFWYVAFGLVLFLLGRPLGRRLGGGLD
jgi:hypothetical protein